MVEIFVDLERCTGCGTCREVCPKGPRIWKIEEKEGKGKKFAVVLEKEACLYCTMCITRCPVDAIKISLT